MRSRIALVLLILVSLFTGCRRSGDVILDDTRSASRHMCRGLKIMCGVNDESRMVASKEDFDSRYGSYYANQEDLDFVPLSVNGRDDLIAMADAYIPQAKESPGDPGSKIPGIEFFKDPATLKELSQIFKNIQFPLDSSAIKGKENTEAVKKIANYMAKHPNLYIFVEGHCDERGAEAYNLALGSRRSQSVRKQLVSEGISPDRIFTISYGKEKPLIYGHDEQAWTQNRRAEFKVYRHE